MEELIEKLFRIPDVYTDFVLGVIAYANKKPEHVTLLLEYIGENQNLCTSDVVEFIVEQPDFHDYSATKAQPEVKKANYVITEELRKNLCILDEDCPFTPKSSADIYADLAESRASYERGEYMDFDEALEEISKAYDI